ncbi:MAG: hypothetical protein GVY08_09425 [Bacteroidetes bacterium]|nr:hypothetical protein [Bacteroidota bacterium]
MTLGQVVATDEAQVEVFLEPDYESSFQPSDTVELDGEPGASAELTLRISSVDGYSGNVSVSMTDIDPRLSTANGDMIDFTLNPQTVSVPEDGSADVTVGLQTLLPIREDKTYFASVQMNDESGNATQAQKTRTFQIEVDGFSPRTIEEF